MSDKLKHLYKKGNSFYHVRGAQWTPLGPDYSEAVRLWAELEADPSKAATIRMAGSKAVSLTFRALAEQYLAYLQEGRAANNTIRSYSRGLNGLVAIFGGLRLQDITRPALIRYHAMMHDKPFEANLHMRVMSACLQYAVDQGMIPHNSAARIRKYKEGRHTLRLSEGILFQSIYPGAHKDLQKAIMLAFHLVQHEQEVKSLKWSDFDFQAQTVSFVRRKTKHRLAIDYGQNEALAPFIAMLRAERADLQPWVIHHNGKPYASFRTLWAKALVAAGFKVGDYQFKEIRHLANTLLKDGGLSAGKRMRMTGHASERTNEIYTHDSGQETIEAGRILGRVRYGKQ